MAKELKYQNLANVGLNGLNTQGNPATLDPSYLTKAENIVLRESGRISLRKGLKQKIAPSGAPIKSIVEHNDQGTNKIFASHGTSIYTVDFTDTDAAFPSSGANVKRTVANTTGDWQFINFNGRLHCLHENAIPQRYDGASDTGERWSQHYNTTAINDGSNINNSVTTITVDSTVGFPPEGTLLIESEVLSYTSITATTFVGLTRGVGSSSAATHNNDVVVTTYSDPPTVSNGEFKPSCGTGFYGRLWVGGVAEEKDVLHYSALLDGDDWVGGGAFDLKSVWGRDDIIAIAPFYGQLAVFGKNNIAIYESPDVIGSMKLNEVIRGVGCIARDSVQHIGDDLVFLSSTGLRSLARTSEKDKVPLTDLSVNIKDTLIRNIGQSTAVKSAYIENEGIYVMTFTASNITYVFDFKQLTPNQAPRVTTWSFNLDREPASIAYTELYGMLVGQKDGSIAGYEGYYDSDLAANGTTVTDASYTGSFATTWVNLGESVGASLLKRLFMVLEGGSGATLGLRWYKDYSSTPSKNTSITLNPTTTGSTSLWGASSSLYGATTVTHTHVASTHPSNSTFAPIFGLKEYRTSLTGSAKNLKIAIDIQSNGFDASLQDLTLLHKQGKIR